jgi:uncharacterized protein (DUF305 family)
MKKGTLLILAAVAVFGAACGQTVAVNNSAMNHDGMNHNGMNHNAMNQNSSMANANHEMNHDAMTSDSEASGAPYDLQFIDTMIHHHEGAIEMSELALKNSQNAELKTFAQGIIDAQQSENGEMKDWREKWFAGKAPAKNMQMPGMADSMKPMAGDGMKKLSAATGKDFDLMFLSMMIEHHQGALTMAKDAQAKAEHAEIKTLAARVIKAQEAEIKKMTGWQKQWSK